MLKNNTEDNTKLWDKLTEKARHAVATATLKNGWTVTGVHHSVSKSLLAKKLIRATNDKKIFRLTSEGKDFRKYYIMRTKAERNAKKEI